MKEWTKWVAIAAVFALVVFPFVNWGAINIRPTQTITVSGTAQQDETNQVAQFYAGVTAANADKQAAIDEVNSKMSEVITNLKEFGIAEEDIKTQNLSVYQDQEQVIEEGRQRYLPGQWRANNSVQIKLRDATRTSELVSVLGASGLTDISGPNFMLDEMDSQAVQAELLQQAVADARQKAEAVARANGHRVTRVLTITEGYGGTTPIAFSRALGGDAEAIQPGTSTVQATATVTFEMR